MLEGIEGHVEFAEGKGGQTIVRLKHACGSTAEVSEVVQTVPTCAAP